MDYVIFLFLSTALGEPIISNLTKKWESCHYLSSNIFRKEERDWKMAYLARAEDTETATIAWNFDFTNEKLIIDLVTVKFETKTYENGVVDLQILNEHGKIFSIQDREVLHWRAFIYLLRQCNTEYEWIERNFKVFD